MLDRAVHLFGSCPFLITPTGDVGVAEFAELVEGTVERLEPKKAWAPVIAWPWWAAGRRRGEGPLG